MSWVGGPIIDFPTGGEFDTAVIVPSEEYPAGDQRDCSDPDPDCSLIAEPWFPLTADFLFIVIDYPAGDQGDRADPDPDAFEYSVDHAAHAELPTHDKFLPAYDYATDQRDTSDPDPDCSIVAEAWFPVAADFVFVAIDYPSGDQLDTADPWPDPFDYGVEMLIVAAVLTPDLFVGAYDFPVGDQLDEGDPDPDASVVQSLTFEPWFPVPADFLYVTRQYPAGDQVDTSDPNPDAFDYVFEPGLHPEFPDTYLPPTDYPAGDQVDRSDPDPDPFDYIADITVVPPFIPTDEFIGAYDYLTGEQRDWSDPDPDPFGYVFEFGNLTELFVDAYPAYIYPADQRDWSDPDPDPFDYAFHAFVEGLSGEDTTPYPTYAYDAGAQIDRADVDPDPFPYVFEPPQFIVAENQTMSEVWDYLAGDQVDREDPTTLTFEFAPPLIEASEDIPTVPATETGSILCLCPGLIEATTITMSVFAVTHIPVCQVAATATSTESVPEEPTPIVVCGVAEAVTIVVLPNMSMSCGGPFFPVGSVPPPGPPTPVLFSGETTIEAIDLGIGSKTTSGVYLRSMFYIPPDAADSGFDDTATVYYLEVVGYNNTIADLTVTVWDVVDQSVPTLANPQTLILPAVYAGRVRSATPFVNSSSTGMYLAEMPATGAANNAVVYRLRVAAVQTNVAKTVSEIRLLNSSGATTLDQTIGGGDIVRTTSYGLSSDNLGFVTASGPRWKYVASAWQTVTSISLVAVVANASFEISTRWSEVALWDLTDDVFVAKVTCASATMFLNPQLFTTTVALGLLTDGHAYEARFRSVKTLVGFNDFNTYLHKVRLLISVGPVDAAEFFARCGNTTGVSESRSISPFATFTPVPSIHFEINALTAGGFGLVSDYGTSDTASTNSPVTDSEVLVPNNTEKTGRSVNIAMSMIDQHRYAADGVLQGSLVYKLPAETRTFPLDASTPRRRYVEYLFNQGYMPTLAVLFEEGSGTPVEFVRGATVTVGGAASWTTDATYGVAGRASATTDFWTIDNIGIHIPTDKCTIFVVRKKADSTKRNSNLAGLVTNFFARWISMNIPVSNTGGVARWNIGSNDQTVAFTVATTVETIACKFGPSGRTIYRDGVPIVTDATVLTRSASNASDDFGINKASSNYANGDIQDFYMVLIVRAEVPDVVMSTFTVDNALLGM